MAGRKYTSQSVPSAHILLNGGLNSTAGPLGVADNESTDIQNIDFDKFGSILKRNGYASLNSTALNSSAGSNGLWWFEYNDSGTATRKLINISGTKIYKMDDLDGTWDDITSGISITDGNFCDFENFLNTVYITNGEDPPFRWTPATHTNASIFEDVPTNLTDARFVKQFSNYLFIGNIILSSGTHPSRIYWSNLKDTGTWGATDFIDVAKDDGTEITGLKVLSDRLVIYKTRSIYNLFFTGDSAIPFVLPGGGKSNSSVGCIAPYTIQDVENGHVFLSHDGLYFYDGNNSFKVSDKVNETLLGKTALDKARSLVQKNKHRYWLATTPSGDTQNNDIIVWDFFHNAFSIYEGFSANAMTTVWESGINERPYFTDYRGFTYRADTGTNDHPLGVTNAVDAYFYTNWKHFGDLIDQKGIPHVTLYHRIETSTLNFAYSYDLEENDTFSQSITLGTSGDTYGAGAYGTATYATSGGAVRRIDLDGRGRVARFKFQNDRVGESFRVEGFGTMPHLETI